MLIKDSERGTLSVIEVKNAFIDCGDLCMTDLGNKVFILPDVKKEKQGRRIEHFFHEGKLDLTIYEK